MNKVFVLYEDHGVPDGWELRAVCDSLDRAMSISNSPLDWTYHATEFYWTFERTDYVLPFAPLGTIEMPLTRRFVIDTVIMNDLEEAE